jgi:hypothetical protein
MEMFLQSHSLVMGIWLGRCSLVIDVFAVFP